MGHTVREKTKLLNRVRRIRGQVESIERALESAKGCGEILHLVAAVRGAIKMATNVKRAGCAVIRHADATKQKLISASGQLNATGANATQAAG